MMLLINISSDSVGLFRDGKSTFIPKNEVIETFHHKLFDIVQDNNITQCFVISGPGSFTTLRAAALVINTLISTKTRTPTLYQSNKISFFDVFVQKQLLPSTGIINIGQKNNMRKVNYNVVGSSSWGDRENNYTKSPISKKEITDNLKAQIENDAFFIEGMYEEELGDEKTQKKAFFVTSIDNCDVENKKGTLNYNYNGQISQIPFFDFKREKVELISPAYMIEAVR